jgi:hypothetical protein
MKYLLLMYADESIGANYTPEEREAAMKTWAEFRQEMAASGVMISSSGVAPGTHPKTVRVRNGAPLVTDGPFAETHEQLGGYFVLDCQNLDEALHWAEKIPTAKYGSIEVRPLWAPGG